jgi:hypothetical protein
MRNFTKQELADGSKYADFWRITLADAMTAAGLDCAGGLEIAAIERRWFIVDSEDPALPVVAEGYCERGRLVAL